MSVVHIGGASGLSVIAIRGESPETSSGLSNFRPCCCQLSLRFHDELVLVVPDLPSLELDPPVELPPLPMAIVCSPIRLLT